jgi:hypothetical protein
MKYNSIIVLLIGFISFSAKTQPPGIDDSIMEIKGKWSKGEAFVHAYDPTLSQKNFGVVYRRLDSIAAFFKKAYPTPLGAEAKWYPNITAYPLFEKAPSPYSFWSLYKLYYYNKGLKKIMLGDETGTWAYVFVNSFNWLLNDTKLKHDGNKIWELPRLLPEVWKGYPVFESYTHRPDAKAIVVTNKERLPWKPVNRFQYLQALGKKTEDDYNKMVADYGAVITKGRKMIDDIRNKKDVPAATKQTMITAAQQQIDKNIQLRDAMLKNIEVSRQKDLKVINDYLAQHSAEELQQQAIINRYKNFLTYKRFEDATSKDATWLVSIDRSYFDTTLPSHAPQFMILYWRWNKVPPGLYFKKQLEENFPIEKLQAMLPKASEKSLEISLQALSAKESMRAAIHTIMQSYAGDPNDKATWDRVQIRIAQFLISKWRDGTLVGMQQDEAFFIRIGTTTMTQSEIASGKLIALVSIAMKKPSEFETIRIETQL